MIWRLIRSAGLALAVVVLLAPATTLADVLILKSGDSVHGHFANRQLLHTDPFALKSATIDVGTPESSDFQNYAFTDIQYLVFEGDNGERDVIDLWSVKGAPVPRQATNAGWPPAYQTEISAEHNRSGSAVMMLAGVAAIATGAAYKFGEKDSYNDLNQLETRKEYNNVNWIMVGSGLGLLVFGAYSFTRNQVPARPTFGWNDDGDMVVGMQTRF